MPVVVEFGLYWLPTVVFVVHAAEELPRFPAWATRHFRATSRAWFVYSHIVLLAIALTISAQAHAAEPRTAWPMLAVALQWVLGSNALFHIITTILFKEYSPGLVTAVLFSIPATAYMSTQVIALKLLTPAQLLAAGGLGLVSNVLGIATLWLLLDLSWRLRRPNDHRAT